MRSRRRQPGFTLIELLVVIVIIATLAAMASLSVSSAGGRNWKGEVQRLANLLQLVADRALIDKVHLGVVVEEDRYSIVRYDSSTMQWQEMDFSGDPNSTNARRFTAHELPPNMQLEVISQTELPGADDQQAEFGRETGGRGMAPAAQNSDDDEEILPQFAALSSGEVLPVEIAVHLLSEGNREIGRSAIISYSSLHGMQLEWLSDDL
ncbi:MULTISPECIES: type II secretion system protein [Microbulbifer]|uniref:Type II secretion system protein n=1 Tax=Microbulbifer celer TaxID=435905 RepID=A0ABW3UBT3_9GAMM|nr:MULTISPECIES: type II secretion system protein [Microbulbifer]UFN58845.1 type II secretion system GspH family protein [Microbulbifer celer]